MMAIADGWSAGMQAEKDFCSIADFLHEALQLAKSIQSTHGRLLKDFNKCATSRSRPPAPLSPRKLHSSIPILSLHTQDPQ